LIEKITKILTHQFTIDDVSRTNGKRVQKDIKLLLEQNSLSFEQEKHIIKEKRDAIDLYYEDKELDIKIIIEIDAIRADQISKKFISRTDFVKNNKIYISFTYPRNKKTSNIEDVKKYMKYCLNVSNSLSKSTNTKYGFIGIIP
jgi:hypothetical protein